MTTQQAFDLALRHHQAGRLADAEALYRQILTVQPNHAETLHHLGVIAHQMGHNELAMGWIRQAAALIPNNPAVHSNLGNALSGQGRFDEAVSSYRRALELKPGYSEAQYNLANALRQKGEFEEAIAYYRQALRLNPNFVAAYYNLGNVLRSQDRLDEAVAAYRQLLKLQPDHVEVHINLGIALAGQDRLDEALAAYRRALELNPNSPEAYNNLGNAHRERGELDEAMAAYRRAFVLKPDFTDAHSNLILVALYHPADTGQEEYERWEKQHAQPLQRFFVPHDNTPDPSRRLKIGYVSPDFRDHVVGRNLVPLFRCHDREQFEIVCYSGVVRADRQTEEFRQRAHHWRDTAGLTDEALTEMIHRDRVDILVDLSQHTARNRLPVFARQPAPVQVSFAGYPGSTGLGPIGYRISDRHLERMNVRPCSPSGPSTEQVYLIDSFWCYDPCGIELEVNPLPAQESGRVTFGSLNHFSKVNAPVLRLWAQVLGKVKDSRLVMLSPRGDHRKRTLEILAQEGVEAHRVEFVPPRERRAYLELYHRLDIALDPFPYNGHTTSLDALWMGVPVISLVGERPVSRGGFSQLSNLGLTELAAFSEDDYGEIATQLAHDLPRLAELRKTLRARMEASPLMDAPGFARNIEAAYRAMWRQWCAEKQRC